MLPMKREAMFALHPYPMVGVSRAAWPWSGLLVQTVRGVPNLGRQCGAGVRLGRQIKDVSTQDVLQRVRSSVTGAPYVGVPL